MAVKPDKQSLCVEQLTIVDKKGRQRIAMGVGEPGGVPYINFYDRQFRRRLTISLEPNGTPHVSMFSKDQEQLLAMGLTDRDKAAGISMLAKGGTAGLTISVDKEGYVERAVY